MSSEHLQVLFTSKESKRGVHHSSFFLTLVEHQVQNVNKTGTQTQKSIGFDVFLDQT